MRNKSRGQAVVSKVKVTEKALKHFNEELDLAQFDLTKCISLNGPLVEKPKIFGFGITLLFHIN